MDYYLEETKNINNKPNFARVLELELADVIKFTEENHRPPRLLLHSCCAPCSSAVLEYISEYFEITDIMSIVAGADAGCLSSAAR